MNMQKPIPRKVKEIAKHLDGIVQGDGEALLLGIMPLESACRDHLSFLYRKKYDIYSETSKAGAIIVGKNVNIKDRTLIIVDNPREAYRKAIEFFYPDKNYVNGVVSSDAYIDSSAKISKSANIGTAAIIEPGVVIEDNVVIMAGAIIGEDCRIGRESVVHYGAVIYPRVIIGKRVVIHANAIIGSEGFGFQRNEEGKIFRIKQVGNVVIEDEVEIGSCTCVDRATLTSTNIRRGSKLDSLVLIGHNVEIGQDVLVIGQTGISGSARIGNAVNLYGQVGIRGHIDIGDRTTVLARGGVVRDTEADSVVAGMPAISASKWRRIVACLKWLPDMVREHRKKKD